MAIETLSTSPARVMFGAGAEARTAKWLAEAGARRVLLVALARHREGADRLLEALGKRGAGVFTTDRPQVPLDVAERARAMTRESGATWVLAHGGGTPIGIAKAVALTLPVEVAAVPTTYSGSERTNVFGITDGDRKTTGRDDRVRPRLVIYDPELTRTLAPALSIDSLLNALAHAVEALCADDATPEARQAAEDSLAPLTDGMRAIARDPGGIAGRTLALRGAASAAFALDGASMGLHHKLAHVLGGMAKTPHARTHATLLPYTLAFNASHAHAALETLTRAWQTDDPAGFVYDLARSLGRRTSLADLGIASSDLDRYADAALEARYPNPRPLERLALLSLLDDAFHDRRPTIAGP